MPIATGMQRLTPLDYLLQHSLLVEKGQCISLEVLRENLVQTGYTSVTQVMEHGEFAARGSILDIFPMGSEKPFRLDFFDDEVDSIRSFDPEDQRSLEQLDQIRCLPAREFPTDQSGIEQFRQNYRTVFQRTGSSQSIYGQISKNQLFAGIEYYLPLFFPETATLFDYLSPQTSCIRVGDIGDACDTFWESVVKRYDDRAHDIERPILEPKSLFVTPDAFFTTLKNYPQYKLQKDALDNHHDMAVQSLPDLSAEYQKSHPLSKLKHFLDDTQSPVLFTVPSAGRREVLFDLLKKIDLQPPEYPSISAFLQSKTPVGILMSPLENGFYTASANFYLIAESDLLGERVQRTRREKKSEQNPEAVIRNLAELSIGQAITHLDHGIGLYQGLEMITSGGIASEYLKLEYYDEATLYVPVTSLHKISRYMGSEHVVLSRLGSDKWNQSKRKAAEKVHDIAAELLTLYAQREAKTGDACTFDETLYQQFSGEFPFEETPDQEVAIDAVVADMRAPRCMDRLVCGDVGFGKTEVAMRAAFIAVQAKKQVAVLVPTTLLAQQHHESFRDRFANWPVHIELLSRFRTGKESSQTIERLKSGKVDIVIGTHKLLGKDIQFNDLGLLIIDEEHRFGVKQKEKIKSLRAEVDILALTATPIPRTLNMSVHGLRDLSIIATPPAKRLSIKTFVHQYQDLMASEAILRELKRGGQVYYLHNDVSTIHRRQEQLQELIPQASIHVAHGQMRERELEQVMSDFYHQRFQVLVCTTIIETGIDIPTANTIIMDRADKLGLAQLHQLRGRVGRSHHQAYAYLFTPPPKAISTDARKRLEAISSFEDLGAGFTLATHDLEIRGTGEILGEDQSGQMQSVGFSLYMDMLQQAVKDLKAGKTPDLDQLMQSQTDIELRIPALFPDTYMPNVNMRLSFYKRLGNISNPDAIAQIKIELVDRFGTLPPETQNLLSITQLRIRAEALGIKRIEGHSRGGNIEFLPTTTVDPAILIKLITQHSDKYALDGGTKLAYRSAQNTAEKRFAQIDTLLAELEK